MDLVGAARLLVCPIMGGFRILNLLCDLQDRGACGIRKSLCKLRRIAAGRKICNKFLFHLCILRIELFFIASAHAFHLALIKRFKIPRHYVGRKF